MKQDTILRGRRSGFGYVPPGGDIGELLIKSSGDDGDLEWRTSQIFLGDPRNYGAIGDGVADDTNAVLEALDVVKSTYNNSSLTACPWVLHPGDIYRVRSPIHLGSTTASGGRIKYFYGNGAKFICDHSGIGVDMTNAESGVYYELYIASGDDIPKILLLQCRFAKSTSQGMRNKLYNLKTDGRARISHVFNYGSETNAYYSPRILASTDTPFGWIISDSGRYWDGSSFVDVKPFIPNMLSSDPVLPGVSTTNNHFFDLWCSNTAPYASGGRGCLQFVGGGKDTFHGMFLDVGDKALRPVMSIADTSVGGTAPAYISMYGFNPHSPNDIAWEHISGSIQGILIDKAHAGIPTTADFQLTSGTLSDAAINAHKIVLQGNANGNNRFYAQTSFTSSGTVEGEVFLANAATISLTGNNAQNRCMIREGDPNLFYSGRDLLDSSSVSTVGTGEDNLKSYSITGSTSFMGASGRILRIRAAGTKTGGAGNKTIKFYLGASSWTVHAAANDTNDWALEVEIYTTGSDTQKLFIKAYEAGALTYAKVENSTVDLTDTQTMKITGQCANGADLITQTLWIVEQG